ncbi:phytanoyl-CoA dioxygenase family protein [Streptomyces olivaceoviridis]
MSFPLSAEQCARFDEDGFLALPGLLTKEEVATIIDVADSAHAQGLREGHGGAERTVHDYDIAAVNPTLWEFGAHERILDAVESLIGPDIQIHHSKMAWTPDAVGKGGVRWHQDFAFLPHSNTSLVSAFIYLDDTTVENGAMRVVRGSHKEGLLDHTDGNGIFLAHCQESRMWADESRIAAIEVPAGSVSIHHCLALHSSGPNHAGRPRRGLIFQYRAADAVQLGGVVFQDTGRTVRGSFPGRARCEAVSFNLPFNVWPGETDRNFGTYDRLLGDEVRRRGLNPVPAAVAG